jgi:hypothetical protein
VAAARKIKLTGCIDAISSSADRHDMKGVWRGLQQLAGRVGGGNSGPRMLRDQVGRLVVDNQRIANVLAAQYQGVSDETTFASGASFDAGHKAQIEATVATHRASTTQGPDQLSQEISLIEVQLHIAKLHNCKAPSPIDGINNELLKYGNQPLHQALTSLFHLEFELEHKAQTPGVIIPLYKKDDPTLAVNYRPITLGSTIDKLYNIILNTRLTTYLERESQLHDAQHGFRKGRSATDNIFMLSQILNARMQTKQDTYLLFLDIEKAYDTVWRQGLLYHIWEKGIQGKMFRVLAQMTDSPTSMVLHNGAFSASWQPGMGWEQGDTLATTMFNIHIDVVLQHVWENHPGVPIPADPPLPPGKLVALMYADDMSGVAASAQSLQDLIDATRTALTTWRLKASVKPTDGSKTAVMVIKGGAQTVRNKAARQQQRPHTWHWGDTAIPQVATYRYLGGWLSETGTWDEHITKRMDKANTAAQTHMPVMTQRRLPWHFRKLTFTNTVQPVLTHACPVWMDMTTKKRGKLDSWQLQIVKRMMHCSPTTQSECLSQELGILPFHMSCDLWMLNYWHRLRTTSSDRLLSKVFNAWSGAANPWQRNINKLLAEYQINETDTLAYSKGKFTHHVRAKITKKLQEVWGVAASRADSAILTRYVNAFGTGGVRVVKNGLQPQARQYIDYLTAHGRGLPVELIMGLRIESLPLRCMHHYRRANETLLQQQQRELCPVCKQAAETPAHFLLECPSYNAARTTFFNVLRTTHPDKMHAVEHMPSAQVWRSLLKDDIIKTGGATTATSGIMAAPGGAAAGATAAATHGGITTAASGVLAAPGGAAAGATAAAAQGGAMAAAFGILAAPGGAATGATAAASMALGQAGVMDGDVHAGRFSALHALADYVVTVWKMRSTALAGRETNGGDPMV